MHVKLCSVRSSKQNL